MAEEKVKYKCPSCGKIIEELKETRDTGKGMLEADCPFCSKKFELNETTMIIPKSTTKYKCPQCEKEFLEDEGKDTVLDSEGFRTTCPYCNKTFEVTEEIEVK